MTKPPAARPWRTFLNVIWEREAQWLVRARGDFVRARAKWVGLFVFAEVFIIASWFYVSSLAAARGIPPSSGLAAILGLTVVFASVFAFAAFATTRAGPSATIDWRSRHVVTTSEAF